MSKYSFYDVLREIAQYDPNPELYLEEIERRGMEEDVVADYIPGKYHEVEPLYSEKKVYLDVNMYDIESELYEVRNDREWEFGFRDGKMIAFRERYKYGN